MNGLVGIIKVEKGHLDSDILFFFSGLNKVINDYPDTLKQTFCQLVF